MSFVILKVQAPFFVRPYLCSTVSSPAKVSPGSGLKSSPVGGCNWEAYTASSLSSCRRERSVAFRRVSRTVLASLKWPSTSSPPLSNHFSTMSRPMVLATNACAKATIGWCFVGSSPTDREHSKTVAVSLHLVPRVSQRLPSRPHVAPTLSGSCKCVAFSWLTR